MTGRKSAHFRVGRCCSPYLDHYSRAFAFSAFLYPQHQQRSLRFACRYRQRYGLTLFRMNLRASRTLPIRRQLSVHGGPTGKDHTLLHTFWFKPISTFGLFLVTAFIGSSLVLVVIAHPLHLTAFVLAVSNSPHGSVDRSPGGYVVPEAPHGVVANFACSGRERPMERSVS